LKNANTLGSLRRRDFCPIVGNAPRPLLMGIDPGLHGAICVVDMDRGDIVDMIDLPTYKRPSKSRKQGFLEFIDVHKVSSLIDMYGPDTALAVLEEPGAMPNQGLQSTFTFGRTCGQIHGVLAGHYVPVALAKPAVWKNALGLTTNKDDSRELASLKFPRYIDLWALKKHNDRAEAALLTVYALKYMSKIINLSRV
jgi:crossover junction endodeoxyribonuclease RuvC